VLASSDLSVGQPHITCQRIAHDSAVGLARRAYSQVVKFLIEALEL